MIEKVVEGNMNFTLYKSVFLIAYDDSPLSGTSGFPVGLTSPERLNHVTVHFTMSLKATSLLTVDLTINSFVIFSRSPSVISQLKRV